ncbi:MAG TPA: PAS domain S-box protein [Gemmataceae bacterium]|nr:PAS domain S-box protein [Gemmataceae bacterium]
MTMLSQPGPSTPRATPTVPPPAAPPGRSRLWVVLGSLVLLHLSHPLTWGRPWPGLWFAPAGLGLALVAWFGPRFAVWLLADGLLVALQAGFVGLLGEAERPLRASGLLAFDAVLGAVELPLAWWLYHSRARGARQLGDPRSAILFLVLVPGLVTGLFALARAGLFTLAPPAGAEGGLARWLGVFWLGRALGVLVLAPPLLVTLTPWLVRRGLSAAEDVDEAGATSRGHGGVEWARGGDWVELAGLAVGAGGATLLLSWLQARHELAGWHLWGIPLLLLVWAGLRQGLRGATLVAGLAAALPLLVFGGAHLPLLQGDLLAQCSIALLVAASSHWLRISETRYRQVVGHIPVVVYSARFLPGPPRPREAEVTLASAASRQLMSRPPEELLGGFDRFLSCVHPEDREVVLAAVAQLARQDQPFNCEYRLNTAADEPVRWVRDMLAPQRDPNGRLIGWEGVVSEVTEQRALAHDLRRTTSMFNALVTNLPAGVFFVGGPHGQPILVNARARHLLGRREDPAAGLDHLADVYRLHRPDGTPYPVQELPVWLALRRGLTAMKDDVVVHRGDGRRIPLVTWAAPVHLEAAPGARPGEAAAAVWVLEDLTALHQAEAARRDSERRLRAVLTAMAEGLVVQDARGLVVDCNPAACTLLGAAPESLRGRPLPDGTCAFLGEDGTPLPPDEYPSRAAQRLARPVRNVVLGVRGQSSPLVRWFLVNAMPLGPGTPAGVVTTFADISSSLQARAVVRASEERYRELVESLPLVLIQSDRDMRVTYMNPAARAATGYETEEVADPAVWVQHIHPDDQERVRQMALAALAGEPSRAEFRFRTKDGAERVAYALAQPRWQDGAVTGVTNLLVDMTRERLLEQELRRAQRLELVGRLAGGIAHDFNNLLNVVLSLADVARGRLPADSPAQQDLGHITTAGEEAARLAAQLLAFSKQQRVVPRRVDVYRVARRTLDLLRSTLPPNVRLDAEVGDGELFVHADETQLQQVLMNLCLNARDAMPEGGALRVRVAPAPPEGACLSVEDEGQGMTEQVQAQIFEPFFSTKEHGTGLGLAVVRQIVESFGGRVEVRSEPGRGSRFSVWLPSSPAVIAAE